MSEKLIRVVRSNIALHAAFFGGICTSGVGWLRYSEGLTLEWWELPLGFAIFTGGWYWILWVGRRRQ